MICRKIYNVFVRALRTDSCHNLDEFKWNLNHQPIGNDGAK